MKILSCAYILTCTLLIYSAWDRAAGQLLGDEMNSFEIFDLDWVNRGDFNISTCLAELMNCWEIIRGDVICSGGNYFESVCGLNRNYCHDLFGDYDSYVRWFGYSLMESYCRDTNYEQYT